jgi:uridine kinase
MEARMPGFTPDANEITKARVVVGIAGGSASGKTTLAQGLAEALGPHRVLVLQQDWYYRDSSNLDSAARDAQNFDRPEALELKLLRLHVRLLRKGKTLSRPDYDFATHTRSPRWQQLEPRELVLLEGTLILTDRALRKLLDIRIYVDTPTEVRLARRLNRDVTERGRDAHSCLEQHQHTVWPMHDLYVEPSRRHADLVVAGDAMTNQSIEALARLVERCLRWQKPAVAA